LPPVWNRIEFPRVVLAVHLGMKFVVPPPLTCAASGIGIVRAASAVIVAIHINVLVFMIISSV
jgi:hypothetical protein